MIRINLLGVERKPAKVRRRLRHQPALTPASLRGDAGAAVGGTGWWFWSLARNREGGADTVAATRTAEAARLKSVLNEVQQFEAQRTQLQERVQLIERLRAGQSVPVQLLDHISRSLPDMLWLTDLQQEGPAVTIQGRSTTLIALSDFVGNLGTNAPGF